MKFRALICSVAAAMLAGCATAGLRAAEPYPADYRRVAQEYVRKHFFDRYSIRDAQISTPKLLGQPILLPNGVFVETWVVCVRANARNRKGVYPGLSDTALLIHGGEVANAFDTNGWQFCQGHEFEPFPEIMRTA